MPAYRCHEEYVSINGIQQYFLHLPHPGADTAVLFLHGGPGQAESLLAHHIRPGQGFCHVVHYDQRGAGKTRLRNRTKPADITLEVMLQDLAASVAHVKKVYNTQKIVLLGHSWGSVLGTQYVLCYPGDVAAYVGMGQVVNYKKGERIGFEKLQEVVAQGGTPSQKKRLAKLAGYPVPGKEMQQMNHIRRLQMEYGFVGKKYDQLFKIARQSPQFSLADVLPLLPRRNAGDSGLLPYLMSYDIEDILDYPLPVFYLCGRNDWLTPSVLAADYLSRIRAPKKDLFWLEDAGHLTDFDAPAQFNTALAAIVQAL